MTTRSSLGALLGLTSLLSVAGCDHPPTIDRVLLTRVVLRSDQAAVLSVTVKDKSGLGDIVGVQLYSQDLGYWFGALSEVSDGVFETTIDWARLNAAASINFEFPIKRVLTVVAEDNAGNSDSRELTLELQCRARQHACDGNCYPVELDCKDI